MAGTTGLEPATSDVTGRRSNQLNYVPAMSRDNLIVTHWRAAYTTFPTECPHSSECLRVRAASGDTSRNIPEYRRHTRSCT